MKWLTNNLPPLIAAVVLGAVAVGCGLQAAGQIGQLLHPAAATTAQPAATANAAAEVAINTRCGWFANCSVSHIGVDTQAGATGAPQPAAKPAAADDPDVLTLGLIFGALLFVAVTILNLAGMDRDLNAALRGRGGPQ